MAEQTEGERKLSLRWLNSDDLRLEFPYMIDSLGGYFGHNNQGEHTFNVYEQGRVVSRELVQSADGKNPTVGVILPGEYHFPTGNNTETLTVLHGKLEAAVDNGLVFKLARDGTIVAPAGSTLTLRVKKEPCFYICRYNLKAWKAE